MRYLAETLASQSSKAEDLTADQALVGLDAVIKRLDSLETELTQMSYTLFEPLLEMLKCEIRELEIIRDALGGGEEPLSLREQLTKAVQNAQAN